MDHSFRLNIGITHGCLSNSPAGLDVPAVLAVLAVLACAELRVTSRMTMNGRSLADRSEPASLADPLAA